MRKIGERVMRLQRARMGLRGGIGVVHRLGSLRDEQGGRKLGRVLLLLLFAQLESGQSRRSSIYSPLLHMRLDVPGRHLRSTGRLAWHTRVVQVCGEIVGEEVRLTRSRILICLTRSNGATV